MATKLMFVYISLQSVSYIFFSYMILFVMPFKHRGDIARALMYMAVCYGYRQPDGGPVLHLSDSPKICKLEKKKKI